ncbi:MAG TPA: hypothetical protein VFZ65_02985 [Planctomycetota bacterium]|nr:hypothetical protein [Planctomycetota bacterium]
MTPPPAKGLVPAGPGSGEAAPDPAAPDPVPPDPGPDLAAPPEPEPDYVVVKLARGQTLIHLAKRYLGDGNRFRELLTLNGWTEADARRLPENQPVRVPRALAPHAGRQ